MARLRCDKPYNVDEARKQKGLPRRKRANPKTTCYELAIRIPSEYQSVMGRKKVTKTVYALNKKDDLRAQVRDFEDEQNATLEALLGKVQIRTEARSSFTGEGSLAAYIDRYVELRSSGSISRQTLTSEKRYAQYVEATIGGVALRLLSSEDVERCILAVPRLSKEWALEKRREYEENRRRLEREGNHRSKKPFGPLRVGGPDLQHKVLKFLREVLNDAVDREVIDRNVAKSRFLSKNFRKGRPLIDPLSEEEAARFLAEVKALPLCSFKVEALLLFSSGMRPEEMLGVRPSGLSLRGTPSARITGAVRRDSNEVEEYTKTSTSRRTVPLDDYTAEAVGEWLDLKRGGWASGRSTGCPSSRSSTRSSRTALSSTSGTSSSRKMDSMVRGHMRSGIPLPPSTSPTERTSRPSRSSLATRPRRTPSTSMSGTYRRQALNSRTATWAGLRQSPREPFSCESCSFPRRCLVRRKRARYTIPCAGPSGEDARGRRQVVRPQLPMLVSAGSNPVARSRDSDAGPHARAGVSFAEPSCFFRTFFRTRRFPVFASSKVPAQAGCF